MRKFKYFGHMKRHDVLWGGVTIMEGSIPAKGRGGRPWRGWVQDVIDSLNMSAAEAEHLPYGREKFRWTAMVANFCSEKTI
uniref:Uncharacterized protein n=1 Tax=Arion vulgaris TaxID=1028688 RepID=A0A0B7B086_9EUPU